MTQHLFETELNLDEFRQEPVFCFTSDMEWSPESMIVELLDVFDGRGVPLTPFVTHDSAVVQQRYGQDSKRYRVGLHPNFLPGSTQGDTPERIIENVCKLWKEAVSFRAHSFFDHTHVTDAFVKRGFRYDSNVNLFLNAGTLPLAHNSGLLRFPVFWEDDTHFDRGLPFSLDILKKHLDSPGLKVFNVHPLMLSLNIPTTRYYQDHKHLYNSQDDDTWRKFIHAGDGVRTLIEAVLDYVAGRGYRTAYLYDLYLQVTGESEADVIRAVEEKSAPSPQKPNEQDALEVYQSGDVEVRSDMVRQNYDGLADNVSIYATSRDFNLRELEIGFIADNMTDGDALDIGCGNGYTLISLARQYQGNFVGLDFSANMIEGAKQLTEKFRPELKTIPEFKVADVRKLPYPDSSFDFVISERLIQNLPTQEVQHDTIREAHRVLRPGGAYLMVEGTDSGLQRLNDLRVKLGLEEIPRVYADFNVSALRFDEEEIEAFLGEYFEINKVHFFGTYYLISRVLHPLLAAPASPKWDARINRLAREIARVLPDVGKLGHVVGYKLIAKK